VRRFVIRRREIVDREQGQVPGETPQRQLRLLYRIHVLFLFAKIYNKAERIAGAECLSFAPATIRAVGSAPLGIVAQPSIGIYSGVFDFCNNCIHHQELLKRLKRVCESGVGTGPWVVRI
jgi:hypothetical protein